MLDHIYLVKLRCANLSYCNQFILFQINLYYLIGNCPFNPFLLHFLCFYFLHPHYYHEQSIFYSILNYQIQYFNFVLLKLKKFYLIYFLMICFHPIFIMVLFSMFSFNNLVKILMDFICYNVC